VHLANLTGKFFVGGFGSGGSGGGGGYPGKKYFAMSIN